MFELVRRNNNRSMNSYNPFRDMEELERSFFGSPMSFFDSRDLAEFKTDITDEGDHFLMEADLPGFDKKDIKLDLEDDVQVARLGLSVNRQRVVNRRQLIRGEFHVDNRTDDTHNAAGSALAGLELLSCKQMFTHI